MSALTCFVAMVTGFGAGASSGQAKPQSAPPPGIVENYAGMWVAVPDIDRVLGHSDRNRGGFLVPQRIEIFIDRTPNKEYADELREARDPHRAGHRLAATGRLRRSEEKEGLPCAITQHEGHTYLWHAFPFGPARAKLWLVPGATRERDLLFVEWFSYPGAERTVSALQRSSKMKSTR